jgi:hypothetical protein
MVGNFVAVRRHGRQYGSSMTALPSFCGNGGQVKPDPRSDLRDVRLRIVLIDHQAHYQLVRIVDAVNHVNMDFLV